MNEDLLPENQAPEEPVSETENAQPSAPPPTDSPTTAPPDAVAQMRQMSRRSFLWSAVAIGAAGGGWRWLSTRRPDDGIPWPLRQTLRANENLARDLFVPSRLAPTFERHQITAQRVNGDLGLPEEFDPKAWKLRVEGLASGEDLALPIAAIKALPRYEMITELKCIEGWSVVTAWAGARLVDFMAKYPPATVSGEAPNVLKKPENLPEYVGLATPDNGYYVGLELACALHPQTLLCYEMNGAPLTVEHGAPLRLVTPLKYGIKNIKRIGVIRYSTLRPADYWAEQGYDWYAGH